MVSFRFSPGTLALHVVIGQMQLLIDRKALGQTKELKNRVKDICLEFADRETSHFFISNCYQFHQIFQTYQKCNFKHLFSPFFCKIYKYITNNVGKSLESSNAVKETYLFRQKIQFYS